MSIAYERWEGTLEYTFMAPVSRLVHLCGISLFSLLSTVLHTSIVLVGSAADHGYQSGGSQPGRCPGSAGGKHSWPLSVLD